MAMSERANTRSSCASTAGVHCSPTPRWFRAARAPQSCRRSNVSDSFVRRRRPGLDCRVMSKFLRYLAWTLIIIGGLIGILRLTVIRWWRVPLGDPYLEASIAPNLRGGDWLILWRGTAPIEGD